MWETGLHLIEFENFIFYKSSKRLHSWINFSVLSMDFVSEIVFI